MEAGKPHEDWRSRSSGSCFVRCAPVLVLCGVRLRFLSCAVCAVLVLCGVRLGWTRVDELAVGDLVPDADGTFVSVSSVSWTGDITTVYNFGVDGFHMYFVGDSGAWVHNCKEIFSHAGFSVETARKLTKKFGPGGTPTPNFGSQSSAESAKLPAGLAFLQKYSTTVTSNSTVNGLAILWARYR